MRVVLLCGVLLAVAGCGADPEVREQGGAVAATLPARGIVVECPESETCTLLVTRLIEQGHVKRRKWMRVDDMAREVCASLVR